MNELILETQSNVERQEEAIKEKQRLVKEVAHHYHIDRDVIYAYADYLHYSGNAWEEGNPLKLVSGEHVKDKISPTFIKLLNIINVLRDVSDLEFLRPYLTALREHGIDIKIVPHDSLSDKTFLEDNMALIEEQQCIICEESHFLKYKGEEAEENQFSTKNKFKELTESYYKINNGIKSEKVINKLTKDMFKNHINNNGISEIIGEQRHEEEE